MKLPHYHAHKKKWKSRQKKTIHRIFPHKQKSYPELLFSSHEEYIKYTEEFELEKCRAQILISSNF